MDMEDQSKDNTPKVAIIGNVGTGKAIAKAIMPDSHINIIGAGSAGIIPNGHEEAGPMPDIEFMQSKLMEDGKKDVSELLDNIAMSAMLSNAEDLTKYNYDLPGGFNGAKHAATCKKNKAKRKKKRNSKRRR